MTDNEIIKALECCNSPEKGICKKCPYGRSFKCSKKMIADTINLINRQKAEIERLESRNNFLEIEYKNQGNLFWERVNTAKSEAIIEFAEKLKERLVVDCDRVCERHSLLCGNITGYPIHEVEECINNLVKEMVGEE